MVRVPDRLASFKPYLLTDNTLAPYHIITQGCLECTERRFERGRMGQIRREAPRRALLMCSHGCHRVELTNALRQVLRAARTDEANNYIAQINAA